ncbi:DUF4256 domain-containing protein [Geomicrobium sp. JCM 19055]|uniref:DUF4256 domain-containing protein n=1 Tax=Geomicrobium sp. JCM 19055 TaxID=1460649 RepID=UPI0005A94340|nr:DUF4256 domain-containing protein [Geomicrobium sp. JCM 19055]
MIVSKKQLTEEQQVQLLERLKSRFEQNMHRHPGRQWSEVVTKLEAQPEKLHVLHEMERTEGEPDLVTFEEEPEALHFIDCSQESPKGRRSVCFDRAGLEARKKHQPENTAQDLAAELGVTLLTESEYRNLQKYGPFDQKTSSWIETPSSVRELGGALFCDYRYGQVFVYHNGASSYYGSRGFRGIVTL